MKYDVVIVGGGFAGCLLAYKLADLDLQILLVEAGSDGPIGDWREGSWFQEARDGVDVESDLPYNVLFSRVKTLGGSMEAWEGYTYRMSEADFRIYSEFGVGFDWPIEYQTLAPYYCCAEWLLGVAGEKREWPHALDERYPLPAFPFEDYEKHIIDACKPLGIEFIHVPQARNSLPYDQRCACLGIGTCNYCPTGARWAPSVSLIPRIKKRKNIDVLADHICVYIETRSRKQVKNVLVCDSSGDIKKFQAREYVLAGGTIDICRLLLASKTDHYPDGVANRNGLVGRYFMDHPILRVQAKTKWRKSSQKRQTNILAASHNFRRFDPQNQASGFVLNLNSRIPTPNIWVAAHLEMLPNPDNRVMLSRNKKDRFGIPVPLLKISSQKGLTPRTVRNASDVLKLVATSAGGYDLGFDPIQLWACHLMGGCRMGGNPEASVVDKDLKCHGFENLYILSCATFPTSGAVNPTLTLGALALRLAQYFKQNR